MYYTLHNHYEKKNATILPGLIGTSLLFSMLFGLNITLCCLLSLVCIYVKLCFIHTEFICSLQLTFDPWLSVSFHLWTLKAECHFDLNSLFENFIVLLSYRVPMEGCSTSMCRSGSWYVTCPRSVAGLMSWHRTNGMLLSIWVIVMVNASKSLSYLSWLSSPSFEVDGNIFPHISITCRSSTLLQYHSTLGLFVLPVGSRSPNVQVGYSKKIECRYDQSYLLPYTVIF